MGQYIADYLNGLTAGAELSEVVASFALRSVKPAKSGTLTAQAYTTVSGDLGKILGIATGASDAVVNLQDPTTTGADAEIVVMKSDGGANIGNLVVKSGSTTICWLQAPNDLVWLKSNGTLWTIVNQISNTPLDALPVRSTRWYACYEGASNSQAVPSTDTIFLLPFRLSEAQTIKAVGTRVSAGVASTACKIGIWRTAPTGITGAGLPVGAPLIADNTGQPTTNSSTDVVYTPATPVWLPAGIYWAGIKFNGAPTVTNMVAVVSGKTNNWIGSSALSNISLSNIRGFTYADAFANNLPTFSAPSLTEATTNNFPGVIYQVN